MLMYYAGYVSDIVIYREGSEVPARQEDLQTAGFVEDDNSTSNL
jgi:hypothetical protein